VLSGPQRVTRGRASQELRGRGERPRRLDVGAQSVRPATRGAPRRRPARANVESVALADAGQRLLENAGPAVGQALESLKTVSARPGEVTGRVRITVPRAAVALIVPRLLPRCRSDRSRHDSRAPHGRMPSRVAGALAEVNVVGDRYPAQLAALVGR